jgi:hypothetical protein
MTIQKFFYLVDPVWLIFFFSLASFGLNIVLTRLAIRKWLRDAAFKTKKIIGSISFIASGFVLIPFFSFESFDYFNDANANAFTRAYAGYAEFLATLINDVFGVMSYDDDKLMIFILGGLYLTLLFAPFLLLAVGFLLLLLRKTTPKQKIFMLSFTFGLGFLSTLFIILSSFLTYEAINNYNRACQQKVSEINEFYLHIDDLCNKRDTLAECPKDESALRAFDPEKYDAMESCTDSIYYFREDYGQAWFIRRNWWEADAISRYKNFPGDSTKYRYSRPELMKVKHTYYDRF